MAFDGGRNFIPYPAPALQRRILLADIDEIDAALDSGPAEGLGVDEVARIVAYLPNALVGLLPAVTDQVDHLDQGIPVFRIGFLPILVAYPGQLHELAVHVQLQLTRRKIADPDRLRSTVAFQPVQFDFR